MGCNTVDKTRICIPYIILSSIYCVFFSSLIAFLFNMVFDRTAYKMHVVILSKSVFCLPFFGNGPER